MEKYEEIRVNGKRYKKLRQKALGRKVSAMTKQKISKSCKTKRPVYCVEKDILFDSIADAARFFGVDRRGIYGCLAGSQKTCNGMHFVTRKDDIDE